MHRTPQYWDPGGGTGMTRLVIAGDIGATKTTLGLYDVSQGTALGLVVGKRVASAEISSLEEAIRVFLVEVGNQPVAAGAFGVSGPVLDGKAQLTNLNWNVSAKSLSRALSGSPVRILNDIEAAGYGLPALRPSGLMRVNLGKGRQGNVSLIAAGSGLGQAFLVWDGQRHSPVASEGGHSDFAPRTAKETRLLEFLKHLHAGRISYERVLSGPGLVSIFNFLKLETNLRPSRKVVRELVVEDAAAVIGVEGASGRCSLSTAAIDMFVSLYGAQAGNLALTTMSIGGVYIGGGIARRILPKMTSGAFMDSFTDKGRFAEVLREIPVNVILDHDVVQKGAACIAREIMNPE